jgi:PAS domain-containing protein
MEIFDAPPAGPGDVLSVWITELCDLRRALQQEIQSEYDSESLEETKVAIETLNDQLQSPQALNRIGSQWQDYASLQAAYDSLPKGYVVTDANGIIQVGNRAFAGWLNVDQAFLCRQPILVFLARKDQRDFLTTFHRLKRHRQFIKSQWPLVFRSVLGHEFLAYATVAFVAGLDQRLLGMSWLIQRRSSFDPPRAH